MLSQKYPTERLAEMLIPRVSWRPFPTVHERERWESLPASVRAGYIADGEEAMAREWPTLLATRYLEFARDGNRSRFEEVYFGRRDMLASLVIAECMEGQGRFLDAIVNGIWLICEESSWTIPSVVYTQKAGYGLPDTTEPIVGLFSAETSALLSCAYYLLGDQLDTVSPLVRLRIAREIQARILTPCLERDDFWWMGFAARAVNNWNPWIHSNLLLTTLIIEADPDRRLAEIAKSLRSLDRFIDPYPADGGCDEGPSYWGRAGASLFDCLETLRYATNGGIDIYDEPLIQNIGKYIYRAQIAEHYFLNFADAPAVLALPAYIVFRYGQRIGDPQMVALGAWAARANNLMREGDKALRRYSRASLPRFLPEVFGLSELMDAEARQPLPRDVWLDTIQVMAARDQEGASSGWYLAAKGGHNAESHNHNDIGQVVVYLDGKPLLVDAGVETYSRKTFGPDRYQIWTMQSAYHTLPTIDGVMQAPGKAFAARNVSYQSDDAGVRFSLDIAGAYPAESGLVSWQRAVTFQRGQGVEVVESYETSRVAGEITLSFLTPCAVSLGKGEIWLGETKLPDGRLTAKGRISFDAERLSATMEVIPISDARLGPIWGDHLMRILLHAKNTALKDVWTWKVTRA